MSMERVIAARSPLSSLEILWRPFEALARLLRGSMRAISRHDRLRFALITALVLLPLLAGGWLLLRKSSFTAVEQVSVSGVHGSQAQAIGAALDGAAGHMSTLDVHTAALRAAVAPFPIVRSVRAVPRFPHGLHIEVIEQPPVAAVTIAARSGGGLQTAVAADGVVLGSALLSSSLPELSAYPGAAPDQPGQRVRGAGLLAELSVLGAAPKALAKYVSRVYTAPGGQGMTVAMHNGLLVYFGDADRPHAKWLSLARVLAARFSSGAVYVDVRVPERPAAGFSSADAPAATGPSATTGSSGAGTTPESTVAALAAGLTDDTNGEPAASTAAPAGGAAATEESESSAPGAGEASSSPATAP